MRLLLLNCVMMMGFFGTGENLSQEVCTSKDLKAWIEMDKSGGVLIIEAKVSNLTNKHFSEMDYVLDTRKTGDSGYSNTSQKGAFTLPPRKQKVLSQSRVNVNGYDQLFIRLKIFKENRLIARDAIVFH